MSESINKLSQQDPTPTPPLDVQRYPFPLNAIAYREIDANDGFYGIDPLVGIGNIYRSIEQKQAEGVELKEAEQMIFAKGAEFGITDTNTYQTFVGQDGQLDTDSDGHTNLMEAFVEGTDPYDKTSIVERHDILHALGNELEKSQFYNNDIPLGMVSAAVSLAVGFLFGVFASNGK